MSQKDRATAAWPTARVGDYTYEAYRKPGGIVGMRKWPTDADPSVAVELEATSQAPAQALQLFKTLADR
jgi:hypothetical protein